VGKELLLKATLYDKQYGLILTTAATLAAVLTVVAAAVVAFKPFFGRPNDGEELDPHAHESDWRQLLGPAVLAVAGAITGLLPFLASLPIAKAVARAVDPAHADEAIKLDAVSLLWPPTTATYLSLGAVAAGLVLYAFRGQFRRLTSFATAPVAVLPERLYDGSLWLLDLVTRVHIRLMSGGTLRDHIRLVLIATSVLLIGALLRSNERHEMVLGETSVLSVLLTVLIVGVAAGLPFLRSAMGMVAVIGVVGFALAVLYARLGAPDVAMTQLAVETLVVVVFVLAILHMPSEKAEKKSPSRLLDAGIALVFGFAMSAIALLATERTTPNPVSAYFAENSYTQGFGRNVVNVILVDFRALDTLGEIVVLAVAAIGVATLIRIAPRRRPRNIGGRS
jgi:multicomponent Na+:H+ antiporter subunit A